MTDFDVVIAGAGPAGAAAALVLAPRHRVVLIDRLREPPPRIGESLIPAAGRLLRDMRILDAFESEGHAPYFGNRSIWGSECVEEADFMRDPDGPGWHLDRTRFEQFLRAAALQRGARLVAPARLTRVSRDAEHWRLAIDSGGTTQSCSTRFLIDASGRRAIVARKLGARRVRTDRLVACWLRGTTACEDGATAGFSQVESGPDGWWYTAPVPGPDRQAGRVLAFHTDHDLRGLPGDADELLHRARTMPGIGRLLSDTGFRSIGGLARTAANSVHVAPAAGRGWLAIGDAALCFDPLSSRGLFNALYTAMTGAMICDSQLEAGTSNAAAYIADLERIRAAYDRHLLVTYSTETRWSDRPFWNRRLSAERSMS